MIINEGRPGKKLPTLTNPGVAGDLLSGKQLIGQDGNIITGIIPSKASTDISVSGRTVTVPAGYYPSQASKSIASATQATPSITVSSGGLITASATQSAGYVASGTKSATKQLTTQAGKTVTPGRTQQTAVASGRYTTGTVYVAGDSDLLAANIKKGVNIFGVAGTYEGDAGIWMYEYPGSNVTTRISSRKIELDFETQFENGADILAFSYETNNVTDCISIMYLFTQNDYPVPAYSNYTGACLSKYDSWQRMQYGNILSQKNTLLTMNGSVLTIDLDAGEVESGFLFPSSSDIRYLDATLFLFRN